MAIAFLQMSICGGRSSPVASAAYQAGETLKDYTDVSEKNYTRKEKVVDTGIILPANAPKKFTDRETLWNAVQEYEDKKARKDRPPQYARKWQIAIPNEWTLEEAKEKVREFCQHLADMGMCVDFGIHWLPRNHHVHVMTTCRPLDKNGDWGKKRDTGYVLDSNGNRIPVIDRKTGEQKKTARGQLRWKRRDETLAWDKKDFAEKEKAVWQGICNSQLKKEDQIDFEQNRKLGLLSQRHLGPAAAALERRGIATTAGTYNRRVRLINAKRLLDLARDEQKQLTEAVKTEQRQAMHDLLLQIVARRNLSQQQQRRKREQRQQAQITAVRVQAQHRRQPATRLHRIAAGRRGRVDWLDRQIVAAVADWRTLGDAGRKAVMQRLIQREIAFNKLPRGQQAYFSHSLYLIDRAGGIHLYAGDQATNLQPGQHLTGHDVRIMSASAAAGARINQSAATRYVLKSKAAALNACRLAADHAAAPAVMECRRAHRAGDPVRLSDSRRRIGSQLSRAAYPSTLRTPGRTIAAMLRNPVAGLTRPPQSRISSAEDDRWSLTMTELEQEEQYNRRGMNL